MNKEERTCQNCKQSFTIEPDDFGFYEKLKVPPPTFCPECRFQRRLAFCNERNLYKNVCGLCGTQMIAMYPKRTPFPVYCLDCYRSDRWDPLSYGTPYDFSKPFFEQYKTLKQKVPRAALVRQGEATGSEYTNRASYNKNCYLLVRANYNEQSLYSYTLWESRDAVDCYNVHRSELAYECLDSIGCYHVQYCQDCKECRDSLFLFDCRNCSNCIGCVGLRNKQYHILNKPYTKQEYEAEAAKLKLDTREGRETFAAQFEEFVKKFIREYAILTSSRGVSGNWLINCKNVHASYQCRDVEEGKNLLAVIDAKDSMDYSYWGRGCELVYEASNCGYDCSRMRFVNESWLGCHDLTYCDNCYSSSNLFGCVGLRSKEYCILNRAYTREEYEALVPNIIEHMGVMPYTDKRGRSYRFGDFFPVEFSASPYNITAAQEHFPLTRDEIASEGYLWQEPEEKTHTFTKSWKDFPSEIGAVSDDIVKEVILCRAWDEQGSKAAEEHNCSKAFRIVPAELSFYRRMRIPLPQYCFSSRHFKRFKKRPPLRLWHRQCMCNYAVYKNSTAHAHYPDEKCPNVFETSYASERPEIVYCEQCYNAEAA